MLDMEAFYGLKLLLVVRAPILALADGLIVSSVLDIFFVDRGGDGVCFAGCNQSSSQ